jgi:hypothetical protein
MLISNYFVSSFSIVFWVRIKMFSTLLSYSTMDSRNNFCKDSSPDSQIIKISLEIQSRNQGGGIAGRMKFGRGSNVKTFPRAC